MNRLPTIWNGIGTRQMDFTDCDAVCMMWLRHLQLQTDGRNREWEIMFYFQQQ